jgi:flagellar FliL protein
MADKKEAAAGAAGGKKKPLLLVVIGLVVVLLVGGGAAAWFLLGAKSDKADADQEAEEAEEVSAKSAKPPVFLTLEPFTVNLASENADRYLQVGIDLKLSDAAVAEKVKQHLPEVRNAILLLLTSKQVEDIATLEGKMRLREEIRDAVNRPIGYFREKPATQSADDERGAARPAKAPKAGVLDVLLTSFVIQ